MNQPTNTENSRHIEDDEDSPSLLGSLWQIVLSFLMFGFSFYLFNEFTRLETTGESKRIHWVVALLYRIGGKWAVVGLCVIIGLALMVMGIRELIRLKKEKQLSN